jgi:CHAD domain-containing protein
MSPSPKSVGKAASGAVPAQRSPRPQLQPMMACDTAFRVVAHRCLGDLTANHQAACTGDPEALHQMRIALTRLRTAVSFFSPMVAGPESKRSSDELKWLNAHLGAVRDLDVAIERLKAANQRRPQTISNYRSWQAKRGHSHRHLARALRSVRYRRLVKDTSDWVENGSWSRQKGRQAVQQRASPIATYSASKLAQWTKKLLKKSQKIRDMGTKKRHRLRLMNKKLHYSIEFFGGLLFDKRASRQQAALKHLRKAQKSLGQLNDDAKGRSLATALKRGGVLVSKQLFGLEREKRLLRTATAAYRKLAALKPIDP